MSEDTLSERKDGTRNDFRLSGEFDSYHKVDAAYFNEEMVAGSLAHALRITLTWYSSLIKMDTWFNNIRVHIII